MKAYLVDMIAGAVTILLLAVLQLVPLATAQVQTQQGQTPQAQTDPATTPPAPNQSAPEIPAAQLDQMLAPIALYPDSLLAQILMAATYPLEVVEADRWLQDPNNAGLKGDQLAASLEQQPWDPSVKSLAAFPQILRMMDGKLDWTEHLGDAFLANQAAVMDSVQRLRQRAQAAGKLRSTPQQVVTAEGPTIVIAPPTPETVYVPVYDPGVVYGDWPYPLFPPFYFPGYFDGVFIGGFGFGWFGFPVVGPLWGWCRWDWHHHWIDYDRGRWTALNHNHPPAGGGAWQHDPYHRHGVPYQNTATRARFGGTARSPDVIRGFRGYPTGANQPGVHQQIRSAPGAGRPASPQGFRPQPSLNRPAAPQIYRPQPSIVRPAAPQMYRPQPSPRMPPSFESFGRGADVRMQANRGYTSRMSAPAFPSGGRAAPGGGRGRR